jgi:DNA-binding NarL/FixJ family response regulator
MLSSVILQASGPLDVFSVIEATSGEEGVALSCRYVPDVVVMDIGLPGINGLEATRQIKEQLPSIPTVMVTAMEEPEWRDEASRAGAAGFLPKYLAATDRVPLLSQVLGVRPAGG